jgi:hypothetical protein
VSLEVSLHSGTSGSWMLQCIIVNRGNHQFPSLRSRLCTDARAFRNYVGLVTATVCLCWYKVAPVGVRSVVTSRGRPSDAFPPEATNLPGYLSVSRAI